MITGKEDAANNYARGHYTIGILICYRFLVRRDLVTSIYNNLIKAKEKGNII